MPPKKGAKKGAPKGKAVVVREESPQPVKQDKHDSPAKNSNQKERNQESALPPIKLEPKSTDRKADGHQSQYWTVVEDAAIVTAYRKYKGKKDYTLDKVVQEASSKLKDRSDESIQGRLQTFFIGLTKTDEEKILKASTKQPTHYARFEKTSKGNYSMKEVSDELPGLESIARSNVTSRNQTPQKSRKASPSPQKSLKKELLAKIEEHDEENNAQLGKRASLNRPSLRPDSNADDSELTSKLHAFMDRLKSEDRKDLEANAKMLARFIQHFACNFCCDHKEVIKIMEKQEGDINIDKVRAAFVKSMH